MRKIFKLSSIIFLFITLYSCFPARNLHNSGSSVFPLSDTVRITDGTLVYALPRTVFTIYVEMERTIERPGPYARYAGDLLGLDKVILNENEYWSIESVRVNSHDELDPSELYVIKSNNIFLSNALTLKKEGLILDLNPAIYFNLESPAGSKETDLTSLNSFDLGSDQYFQLQRDTAFRRVSVDSTFIRIPYIVEKKRKLTVEQLAERAARQLMEMREGKHLILTGEATVFPQNSAPIEEINRMEKQYTELFAGKVLKERKTFSYTLIPKNDMINKPVELLRFSELTGPLPSQEKGGIPVNILLTPEQKTKAFTLINSKPEIPGTSKNDKLYYRIPDIADIKIMSGNELLYNSRRMIYQIGEVMQLPSNYIIGK